MILTDVEFDLIDLLVTSSPAADAAGCETTQPPCSAEAVYRLRWGPDTYPAVEDRCCCSARSTLHCLSHGETYLAAAVRGELVLCDRCLGFMLPVFSERIRVTV